jgi:hypothetical protein
LGEQLRLPEAQPAPSILIVRSSMIVALALACFALVVALNCVATVRIVRSDLYTSSQKTAQILIIWAIPIVGSIMVLSILKATEPPRGYASDVEFPDARITPNSNPNAEPWDYGGSDGAGHHGS